MEEEAPVEEVIKEPVTESEPVAEPEEEPIAVPEIEEEQKKPSKRRQMKAHVVSINGKKVNAYMYIENDDNGEEAPKVAPKKATPTKKAEPAKKPAPEKKSSSSFPIISKKYDGDRYVLQTSKGYYVSDNNFVMRKKDAKLFDSKESVEKKQAKFGGKVVKL